MHGVVLDAHALIGSQLRQGLLQALGRIDGHQQPERAGWVGGPAMERRVELVDVIDADAGDVGDDLQVDLPAGLDRHEVGLVEMRLNSRP